MYDGLYVIKQTVMKNVRIFVVFVRIFQFTKTELKPNISIDVCNYFFKVSPTCPLLTTSPCTARSCGAAMV